MGSKIEVCFNDHYIYAVDIEWNVSWWFFFDIYLIENVLFSSHSSTVLAQNWSFVLIIFYMRIHIHCLHFYIKLSGKIVVVYTHLLVGSIIKYTNDL